MALDLFFAPITNKSLVSVLLCVSSPQISRQFANHILRFFNTLFKMGKVERFSHIPQKCSLPFFLFFLYLNPTHLPSFFAIHSRKRQRWIIGTSLRIRVEHSPSGTRKATNVAEASHSKRNKHFTERFFDQHTNTNGSNLERVSMRLDSLFVKVFMERFIYVTM